MACLYHSCKIRPSKHPYPNLYLLRNIVHLLLVYVHLYLHYFLHFLPWHYFRTLFLTVSLTFKITCLSIVFRPMNTAIYRMKYSDGFSSDMKSDGFSSTSLLVIFFIVFISSSNRSIIFFLLFLWLHDLNLCELWTTCYVYGVYYKHQRFISISVAQSTHLVYGNDREAVCGYIS